MLLVFERVGLGEDAAATVAEEVDFAQVERDANGFNVVGHGLDGVLGDVLEALGFAGAALVDKDEAVGAARGSSQGRK